MIRSELSTRIPNPKNSSATDRILSQLIASHKVKTSAGSSTGVESDFVSLSPREATRPEGYRKNCGTNYKQFGKKGYCGCPAVDRKTENQCFISTAHCSNFAQVVPARGVLAYPSAV